MSNRSWITDKRITPPHLKGFSLAFRKSWKNMLKEFNIISPLYQKHKEHTPLLRAIREVKLFKDIIGFNHSTLTPINSNVIVSFRYKETIIYTSNPNVKYIETHSHSFISTYTNYQAGIGDFLDEMDIRNSSLSPILSYKIVLDSEIDLTPTNLPITIANEYLIDYSGDDLEDFLDLDMNGLDEIALCLDDNYSIPTTDKYDKKINRCVYDYLIGYYDTINLSYYKLYNIFHDNKKLVDISDKIIMWEKETNRNYNKEIREHNLKIDKSRIKYGKMTDEQATQFLKEHPKQQKEYDLQYTHEPPARLEVKKWNIPDKYLLHITDKKIWGVTIRMVIKFCDKLKICMYALNQNNKCIKTYLPESNNGFKSLCFKMVMGHFYGIDCSSTIFKIAQVNSQNKSTIFNGKTTQEACEKITKIIEIDAKEGCDGLDVLIKCMEENNILVSNKNVIMKNKNVVGFKIGNNNYRVNNKCDEQNWGKELDTINKKEWDGRHIIQKTTDIFKETCDKHISNFNNQSHTFFNLEGIKNRVHIGLIDNETHEDILYILSQVSYGIEGISNKNFIDYGEIRKYYNCYDINKCYASILKTPLEKWLVYDFKDIWEDYKQSEKVLDGLYFIKTNDITLFHTSNIYSSAIVSYGIKEGIINHNDIKYQLISHNPLSKDYFLPFIQKCLKEGKNDKKLCKTMINLITGICGKTSSSYSTINISKELSEMVSFLQEEANTKPFVYTRELNDDKVFFYGNEKVSQLQEHSLPIYIQILDQSNIKLYEMLKACGNSASCIYRKTDCILIESSSEINLKLGEDWGEYSNELYPKKLMMNHYDNRGEMGLKMLDTINKLMVKEWEKINIINSNEYEAIYKATRENKGLMLLGRAGTGKSYAINKINEIMKGEGKEMKKIAFTNTAALNIGGTTIHKFLRLNKEGHLLWETISFIKNTYDLIVIDEISMISSYLWRRLYQLQDKTQIPFLLVGDFRQIPPVEQMIYEDYREHPTLKLLGGYSYCELETIHRYDNELSEITQDLDGMMKIDKSQFVKKLGKVNICFTNHTRRRINQVVNVNMNKKIGSNILSVRRLCEDKEEKKGSQIVNTNPTQDIYLYEGLPMIARITHNDLIVNNERFIIKKINEDIVVLVSERPDEEGNKTINEIEIEIKDLQKYLLCAYCVTTHKSQGITIDGALTIHDWELMDKKLRYTAITRAKKLSNIYMI
tara:strand:- start:986 stop:4603 length:3618 start_codon:yes stop_codon:yes gene_type:complete